MPEQLLDTPPYKTVLELLSTRIKSQSLPGQRDEDPPRKLGLVIEGGTMRGVVSAGMAHGLAEVLNGTYPFDVIHTSSAGACAGVYLASEQASLGVSVYYDYLGGRKFIDPLKALRGRPFINISYLMEIMWNEESPKRLEADKVLEYPVPIHIYGTDTKTCEPEDFYPYKDSLDLRKSVESAIKVPFYGGDPVEHRGKLFVDSGLSVGKVPVLKAVEDGCTDILVLWTSRVQPANYRHPLIELPIPHLLKRDHPELAAKYWTGHKINRATIKLLEQAQRGEISSLNIEVVRLADPRLSPSPAETNPHKLYMGAKAGRNAMLEKLIPFGLIPDPKINLLLPQ